MYNEKSRHIRRRHNTVRQLLSSGIITIDYVKSSDNMSDPLTKGLGREKLKDHLREWVYGLGQVNMTVTLSRRLDILTTKFKKNKVVADGSILSINSIHSHDEYNIHEKG